MATTFDEPRIALPAARDDNMRLAATLQLELLDRARQHDDPEMRGLAAEVLAALDAASAPAADVRTRFTQALRLEYALTHGWPKCARSTHPRAGEALWYWGDDESTAPRFPSALAALDAAIVAAAAAEDCMPGCPGDASAADVAPWRARLPADEASCSAQQLHDAVAAENADLRAARQNERGAYRTLRAQYVRLQARVALLRTRAAGTSAEQDFARARAVVINLLHAAGLADDEIADDLSLNAVQVLMLRTQTPCADEPAAPWQQVERERILFEATERCADLSRAGRLEGEPDCYVDPAVQQRWTGWLRKAGAGCAPGVALG